DWSSDVCSSDLQEQPGVAKLVFIRRVIQELHALLTRRSLFLRRTGKPKVTKRLLIVHQQIVEESIGRIHAMAKDYVSQFMSQNRCQAGFIGKHIDQASA